MHFTPIKKRDGRVTTFAASGKAARNVRFVGGI